MDAVQNALCYGADHAGKPHTLGAAIALRNAFIACPTLTTVQSGGTEAKVVIRVKENTARGYSDFAIGGGICDLSYPNSTTRRGRIQPGGLVSPTLTTGNVGICAVRFERGGE